MKPVWKVFINLTILNEDIPKYWCWQYLRRNVAIQIFDKEMLEFWCFLFMYQKKYAGKSALYSHVSKKYNRDREDPF